MPTNDSASDERDMVMEVDDEPVSEIRIPNRVHLRMDLNDGSLIMPYKDFLVYLTAKSCPNDS